ncbi:Protein of unknown function [Bacillus wiedmannii]|nr:Protein of unknown function [Bacillus wiedmannii]
MAVVLEIFHDTKD